MAVHYGLVHATAGGGVRQVVCAAGAHLREGERRDHQWHRMLSARPQQIESQRTPCGHGPRIAYEHAHKQWGRVHRLGRWVVHTAVHRLLDSKEQMQRHIECGERLCEPAGAKMIIDCSECQPSEEECDTKGGRDGSSLTRADLKDGQLG